MTTLAGTILITGASSGIGAALARAAAKAGAKVAAAAPFHRSLRRSRSDAPSIGTTPSPSRASRPDGTWSMISAASSIR